MPSSGSCFCNRSCSLDGRFYLRSSRARILSSQAFHSALCSSHCNCCSPSCCCSAWIVLYSTACKPWPGEDVDRMWLSSDPCSTWRDWRWSILLFMLSSTFCIWSKMCLVALSGLLCVSQGNGERSRALHTCKEAPCCKHRTDFLPCNYYMMASLHHTWTFSPDIGSKPRTVSSCITWPLMHVCAYLTCCARGPFPQRIPYAWIWWWVLKEAGIWSVGAGIGVGCWASGIECAENSRLAESRGAESGWLSWCRE